MTLEYKRGDKVAFQDSTMVDADIPAYTAVVIFDDIIDQRKIRCLRVRSHSGDPDDTLLLRADIFQLISRKQRQNK